MKARTHVVPLPAMVLTLCMIFAPMAPSQAAGAVDNASAPTDWNTQVKQTTLAPNEPLTLVARTAEDCTYCRQWLAPAGGKHEFDTWAAAHPDDRLVIVERSAIAKKEVADDYPESLRWMFEQNRQHGELQMATPTFELYAGKQLVWRSSGLPSWDKGAFPAIKDLEARRQAKSSRG